MSGRDALIVWGGWDGHEPERCAGIVAAMLEGEGFAVEIESTTEAFADPGIRDLSLIVPIVTMSTIEKEELDNLCAAVAGGVGLGGFHGGMGDAFRREPAYQFMCGGQWVAHPGNIIDYRVAITRRTTRSWRGSATSTTAPSSITCMSIHPTRCWRPRPSRARIAAGSRAW